MGPRSPSLWLLIAVVVTTATMVHPGFAALVTLPLDLALLVLLRWAAHREGRLFERRHADVRLPWPSPEARG